MAVNLFGSGISALLSSQRALATTSHNISNVNTEGYTRQRVELQANTPEAFGAGFIGTGVRISNIERLYDGFLASQIRNTTSSFNQLDQYYSLTSQVDNALADSQSSISTGMNDFFNALQVLANDPSSTASRQTLLGEASTLTDKFHYMNQRLDDMRQVVNGDISNNISEINSLSQSIADLNKRISEIRSLSSGEPNDLLDQRDLLVEKMSKIVSVKTLEQDDGSVNVFIGNGQAMVVGFEARSLDVKQDPYDVENISIAYVLPSGSVDIGQQITGGTLGGLLQFRDEVLNKTQDSLGYLAIGLSTTFNAQHRQGMDQNGNLGGDFFEQIAGTSPYVLPNSNNTGVPSADITAVISDINNMPVSSYQLERNGGTYTITRLDDNTTTTLVGFPGVTEQVDGMRITLNSGTIADGDSFIIHPFRNAAADINVQITSTDEIAAAGPIRTGTDSANIGDAQISAGDIYDLGLYDGDNYTITFNTANTFEVRDSANNLELAAAYVNGGSIQFNGIDVAISGTPQVGDSFTVDPNVNGVGDNRNALKLVGLQNKQNLTGSTATYSNVFGNVVVDVGTRTRQAEISRNAQQNMLEQTVSAREAKSGVNLDEEAANMLTYQQMYQAAAQVISTANSTFQSLLDILRR